MRPFVCERPNCAKRFWTSQHLRAHQSWHDGAKPYKVRSLLCSPCFYFPQLIGHFQCSEADCLEAFAKHHQLRAHTCAVHALPGTKPFICGHNGCTKSFNTNQHLQTHQKIHDGACNHLNFLTCKFNQSKL